MIVTMAQLYRLAHGKFAVGAYNIDNIEQCPRLSRGNVKALKRYDVQKRSTKRPL